VKAFFRHDEYLPAPTDAGSSAHFRGMGLQERGFFCQFVGYYVVGLPLAGASTVFNADSLTGLELIWASMLCGAVTSSLLVFAGCLMTIIPGGVTGGNQLMWIVVYGFSSLPLGMAGVLQEEAFAKFPMTSALQMTTWSTMYGVLFFVLTTPVTMLPGLLYDDSGEGLIFPRGATWAQLWAHQQDAFACFVGQQPLPERRTPPASAQEWRRGPVARPGRHGPAGDHTRLGQVAGREELGPGMARHAQGHTREEEG